MKKGVLYIKGMHCVSCENVIEEAINKLEGVESKVSYVDGTAIVTFDEKKTSIEKIKEAVIDEGYNVTSNEILNKNENFKKHLSVENFLKLAIIIFGLNYILLKLLNIYIIKNFFNGINSLVANVPIVDENTSLFILFFIGLLTSVHCVAMCGGINVTQCITFKGEGKLSANLMYNFGRVTSYTLIGGIVGAIGSVFTLNVNTQALIYVFVGFFMIIMGLNLFGLNIARKFLPKMPNKFRNINKRGKAPYMVGLINGLMPCGPLQTMQIYALSTGNFIDGAISMFIFSVGTVPLMYLFGKIGDFKNPQIAKDLMKISAILVIILGILMANRGLSLFGFSIPKGSSDELVSTIIEEEEQLIYTDLNARSYPDLVVKKGKPVKWVINATKETLNGCNNEIIIGEYNIQKKLEIGENIIEFFPTESGTFRYSCWMGMIRGDIKVID